MRKVSISLAPFDYANIKQMPSPEDFANDVFECYQAGASVAHFHVVDQEARPTSDTTWFQQSIGAIREKCDIIIQGSTGGVGVSWEARSAALDVPGVEMASLNMGSCNIGNLAYINTPEEIRQWAKQMKQNRIIPDMAIFEPGMFSMLKQLQHENLIDPPYVIGLPMGFPNAVPAAPENLVHMVNQLPENAVWSIISHHASDYQMLAAAIACGGNIRVGFEDSAHLTSTRQANSNAELVAQARDLIHLLGQEAATADETRKMYGITG